MFCDMKHVVMGTIPEVKTLSIMSLLWEWLECANVLYQLRQRGFGYWNEAFWAWNMVVMVFFLKRKPHLYDAILVTEIEVLLLGLLGD